MEESVVTAPEPATVFAFGPEDVPVDGEQNAEPAGEDVQAAEDQTVEAEGSATGVDDQITDQESVNRAIGREKHRIREQARQEYERKLADDPYRKLGRIMAEDLMDNQGISEEEAIKKATDNMLKAIASRENVSIGMARKLYGNEARQEAKEQQSEIDRIVADVQAARKPAGFDEATAYQDSAFLDLLQEYPAEAAIRIYMAENKANHAGQDYAERLKARQAVPQSTRPQQAVKPKTDWTQVSTEDFMAEKARRSKFR